MKKNISEQLDSLLLLIDEIKSKGQQVLHPQKKVLFDTYCIAQLNRSLNLIDGFITLSRADNFITSMALVRLHLDTLLRIYAIKLSGLDTNVAVEKILGGTRIEQLTHGPDGKPLRDSYLKNEISKLNEFKWVAEAYEVASGFVHFSDNILRASNVGDSSNQTLKHAIELGSSLIKTEDKQVACALMQKITEGIFGFIDKWIEQRD